MNEKEVQKNFEYLINFRGYGSSKDAKIFYFGIEPGGTEELEDFRSKVLVDKPELVVHAKIEGPTERVKAKLSYMLITEILREKEFNDTLDEFLEKDIDNYSFHSNLYPLKCPREKDKDIEKECPTVNGNLTGFKSKNEYKKYIWENGRGDILRNLLTEIRERMYDNNDIYIFVLMSGDNFKKMKSIILDVFGIDPYEFSKIEEIKNFKKTSTMIPCFYNRIWFVPQISWRHFTEEDIKKVISIIKSR